MPCGGTGYTQINQSAEKEGAHLSKRDQQRFKIAFEQARRLFENDLDACAWLNESSAALGNVTPVSLLKTDTGLEAVLYELSQMEYGHPV